MGSHPKLQYLISEPPYFNPVIRPTNSESLHPPSLTATYTTATPVQSPCWTSAFCHSNPGKFGEAAGKAASVVVGREDTFAAVAPVDDRLTAVRAPHAKRSSPARLFPVRWLLSMLRM